MTKIYICFLFTKSMISKQEFEKIVIEALDDLPGKFKFHMNNVAITIEDLPSREQLGKVGRRERYSLFGLYEGYVQSRRIYVGPVLPDKITLFYRPIVKSCSSRRECKKRIIETLKHEIAHHFGSDEDGAEKAAKRTISE